MCYRYIGTTFLDEEYDMEYVLAPSTAAYRPGQTPLLYASQYTLGFRLCTSI